MNRRSAPQRPADYAEESLVTAILGGSYPPGSTLPGERDLAAQLGITRPTLREALQRLACEGWLTIRQGKATQVNDFWREGGLNVLGAMVRYSQRLPADFVANLLEVRLALAPAYIGEGVAHAAQQLIDCLADHDRLADEPSAFAGFDWNLHHAATVASGNPVYTLILNGFAGFYEEMACLYFSLSQARAASQAFYAVLLDAARHGDASRAKEITRETMQESICLWKQIHDSAKKR